LIAPLNCAEIFAMNPPIKHCPACLSDSTSVFLTRPGVPVNQHTIFAGPSEAIGATRGDLSMASCAGCGFIFNATFDPSLLRYDESYDNSQENSPAFRSHTDSLVGYLVEERGVRESRVLEIGCGKGSFLRRLVLAEGAGNQGLGLDTSYEGPLSELGGLLNFERRPYGPDCADIPADVVVCRHVIEHIPRPLDFLKDIRRALVNSTKARLFFETPCSEWILDNRVIWDFFYEHCSIFTAASLSSAFARAGFEVQDVHRVFNGQYLWLEATVGPEDLPVRDDPSSIPSRAERFATEEARLNAEWLALVDDLGRRGKVALWGAGAKGVTFANLIDPGRERIECLVDMNPQKQGKFVPGTGHSIVDYHSLQARGVASAILMNANYRGEIESILAREGIPLQLVSAIPAEEGR
jgi:SAM-dependent methyltransferase